MAVVVAVGGCGDDGSGKLKTDGGTDARRKDGGADARRTDAGVDAPKTDARVDAPQMDGPGISDAGRDAPQRDAGSDARSFPPDAAVPTNLTATVLDRRNTSMQLLWPAPAASNGGSVAGYDIRVARVPITATNFDDTSATISVSYPGTPSAPGRTDGMVVPKLNIEQGYYFAIAGKDANGVRSAIMATATSVQATFLTVVLTGNGTDGFGGDLDGSGDFGRAGDNAFTADGFSDLVVGGNGGAHVYVYFGSSTGYSVTPSITITGAVAGFGQAVVNAGDLDGDGLPDIAIASPGDGGGGKVYVFSRKNSPASWGTTNTWPATLTDAQANYVLTADATFAGGTGSIQPGSMARLGNFDGSGSDDLAIGFVLHASDVGSLLIVKGSTTFASMSIPGTGTIEIDGTAAGGFFGYATIGIGPFFASPAGPGLVTTAIEDSIVYAFKGQSPSGVLTTANAAQSVVAARAADLYGYNLGFLGKIGTSPGAVTVGVPYGSPSYVDVHLGAAANGPLLGPSGGAPMPTMRLVDSAQGNSFGAANFGGGIKGTGQSVSFIGDDTVADLVVAAQAEVGQPLYIINGAAIPALPAMVDVSANQNSVVPAVVQVANHIPTGWVGYAGCGAIVDANKDGYGDFAVGEYAAGKAGRVVVFY